MNAAAVTRTPGSVGTDPLDLARRTVGELAPTVDYAQVFVERTVEMRVDCRDGDTVSTAVELREGIGCLTRSGRAWRYRSRPLTGSEPDLDELSAAFAYVPVPADRWVISGEHTLRSIEDSAIRVYAVADTDGVAVRAVDHTVRHRLEAIVTVGGSRFRGMSRRTFRDLGADTWSGASELAGVALGRARNAASAVSLGTRRTPVVFGPRAAVSFLHELIGHAMEVDNAALDTPYLAGLRRPGAIPRGLTLFDDPTLADGFGSYAVDDEGTPAARHALVLDGEYGSPVTSRRTAAQHRVPATANGRRRDYTHVPIPRASNTVALPGTDSLDTMARDPRDGVLWVDGLGSGMIRLTTGEYSFAALDCVYVTPDGNRVAVPDVNLVGDALGTLARIEAIGPDFEGDNASCGKRGQLVGIGVYGPSMRFAPLVWSA